MVLRAVLRHPGCQRGTPGLSRSSVGA